MKNYIKVLALAVLAISACSKETAQLDVVTAKDPLVLKAHYAQTKSTVTDAGKLGWSETDSISVYTGIVNPKTGLTAWGFEKYVIQSGVGTADAEFFGAESTAKVDKIAVFPSAVSPALSGTALTVTLPNEYDYLAGETNVPMIAQVTDGVNTDLSIKHLGGLLKLTINNVPSEASLLYFIASGKNITGEFTVADYSAEGACIETEDGDNDSIIFNIDQTAENMTFYVPLPVGEYPEGFVYAFFDSYGDMCSVPSGYGHSFTVERADLLLAPEDDTWIIDNGWYMMARYDDPEIVDGGWVQNLSFLIDSGVSYKFDIYGPFEGYSPDDFDYSYAQYFADNLAQDSSAGIYSEGQSVSLALEPGTYVAVMVQVDEDGNSLNRYCYVAFEVIDAPTEGSEAYKKWLGTWSISGIDFYEYLGNDTEFDITFNGVTISQYIPDNSFTIAHWETDVEPEPWYNWDETITYSDGSYVKPTFKANYDTETGKLVFVAENVLQMSSYYLGFNDYFALDDGDVLAEATLSEDGTTATITSVDAYSIGYYVINNDSSIYTYGYTFLLTDGENDFTTTMVKTSDATSAPAASGVKLSAAPAVKKAQAWDGTIPSASNKAFPAKLSKKSSNEMAPLSKVQPATDLAPRKMAKTLKK